jgi:hypothetical protein
MHQSVARGPFKRRLKHCMEQSDVTAVAAFNWIIGVASNGKRPNDTTSSRAVGSRCCENGGRIGLVPFCGFREDRGLCGNYRIINIKFIINSRVFSQ